VSTIRVLLIENNAGDAELLAELLNYTRTTCDLTHVRNLDDATEWLGREHFDVILTGLLLPDADHGDVVPRLVSTNGPAVVVLTGLDDDSSASSSLAAGAQDYLVKGQFDALLLEHSLLHSIERNRLLVERIRTAQLAEAARAESESARRASEERFAAFMDASPVVAAIKDTEDRYVWVNQTWEAVMGVEASAAIGKTLKDVLPDNEVRWTPQDDDVVRLQTGEEQIVTRDIVTAENPGRFYDTFQFSFDDAEGRRQLGAIAIDITERRIAEEALARQSELNEQARALESLGRLAGGVAHDFNNLLGVIINYAALIGREVTDSTVAADLAEIRAAAESGVALTRQLLTFARRTDVDPQPLELTGVVRSLASMIERSLGEHISTRLVLADDPVWTRADRHQIEQVLLNLAFNARDAMPDGGVLTIVVGPAKSESESGPDTDAGVEIAVRDNGQGMTPEVAARAFEPFFTTKPLGEGTGLGLATVHGIVAQNGGSVTIDSKVGSGTRITVRLPAEADRPPDAGPELEPLRGGDERVLLLEDEAPLRVATERLLAEHGYHVVTACDGLDGLKVLDREKAKFDVIVTDVVMPHMRGDEFAGLLASRGYDIPVIFLSGYRSNAGPLAGPVITKPAAEDILLQAIRDAIDG
jgi:PAS domain S-box-containing protein